MFGGYQKNNITDVAKATQIPLYLGKKTIINHSSATEQTTDYINTNIHFQRQSLIVTIKDNMMFSKSNYKLVRNVAEVSVVKP